MAQFQSPSSASCYYWVVIPGGGGRNYTIWGLVATLSLHAAERTIIINWGNFNMPCTASDFYRSIYNRVRRRVVSLSTQENEVAHMVGQHTDSSCSRFSAFSFNHRLSVVPSGSSSAAALFPNRSPLTRARRDI